MAKVIGILSLKGGVGKTSTVVSLGDALASFGKKVLLIDCNFSAPNLVLHLNMIETPITLHHVLNRSANIKECIYKSDKFDIIPASIFGNFQINPFLLRDKLKQIKKKYDFILLDSSPGLTEETLSVILASDKLLLVVTPDHVTMSNSLKSIKMARERGIDFYGVIINKSHDKSFELSVKDIEQILELPVLAVIPYDREVLRALSKFIPYTTHMPRNQGSIEYMKLAGSLSGVKYKTFSIKNIFRITPKPQEINRELFYEQLFN